MPIHKTIALNTSTQQVYRVLKSNFQKVLPQMFDFIQWNDAEFAGSIDYMNEKGTIAVTDAIPAICTIDLSIAPPAALWFSEQQAEPKIRELLTQLQKELIDE